MSESEKSATAGARCRRKPVAGVVIGGIAGLFGLWGASPTLIGPLPPSYVRYLKAMPSLAPWYFGGQVVTILLSSMMLIGVVLTAFNRLKGPHIVRTCCVLQIASVFIQTGVLYLHVLTKPAPDTRIGIELLGVETIKVPLALVLNGSIWFLFGPREIGETAEADT